MPALLSEQFPALSFVSPAVAYKLHIMMPRMHINSSPSNQFFHLHLRLEHLKKKPLNQSQIVELPGRDYDGWRWNGFSCSWSAQAFLQCQRLFSKNIEKYFKSKTVLWNRCLLLLSKLTRKNPQITIPILFSLKVDTSPPTMKIPLK